MPVKLNVYNLSLSPKLPCKLSQCKWGKFKILSLEDSASVCHWDLHYCLAAPFPLCLQIVVMNGEAQPGREDGQMSRRLLWDISQTNSGRRVWSVRSTPLNIYTVGNGPVIIWFPWYRGGRWSKVKRLQCYQSPQDAEWSLIVCSEFQIYHYIIFYHHWSTRMTEGIN